jgi:hypothetical protein
VNIPTGSKSKKGVPPPLREAVLPQGHNPNETGPEHLRRPLRSHRGYYRGHHSSGSHIPLTNPDGTPYTGGYPARGSFHVPGGYTPQDDRPHHGHTNEDYSSPNVFSSARGHSSPYGSPTPQTSSPQRGPRERYPIRPRFESGWDSSAVDAYSCPRCGVSCSNPFAICQCELPASPYDHPSQPESTGRPTPYAHSGSNVPSRPENVRRSTSYSWTPTHDRPFQPQSTPLYDVCSRGKGW